MVGEGERKRLKRIDMITQKSQKRERERERESVKGGVGGRTVLGQELGARCWERRVGTMEVRRQIGVK
jgi:hypothetical protein